MIREHHIETSKTARYYTIEPNGEPAGVLFVIHGYRQLAKYFIKHFQHLAHAGLMIVAPEGLHRFYIEGYDGRVGASWMTKEDREVDINDYINYLNLLHKNLTLPKNLPIDILGFSQGGPTACRWLASCDFEVRNLILHSTVFPNDFDFKGNMNRLSQADVYSVFGDQDQFASEDVIADKMEWMRGQGVESKLLRFHGGHEVDIESLERIYSLVD